MAGSTTERSTGFSARCRSRRCNTPIMNSSTLCIRDANWRRSSSVKASLAKGQQPKKTISPNGLVTVAITGVPGDGWHSPDGSVAARRALVMPVRAFPQAAANDAPADAARPGRPIDPTAPGTGGGPAHALPPRTRNWPRAACKRSAIMAERPLFEPLGPRLGSCDLAFCTKGRNFVRNAPMRPADLVAAS